MVIDTIQDVSTPTVPSRDDTTLTAASWTTNSDLQEPTDMLHALHRDEKELRVLAVVLSLTGGLVLSFLLGVGIFVYWHWRAWRTRQRKKLIKLKNPASSIKSTTPPISPTLSIRTDILPREAPALVPPSSSSPRSLYDASPLNQTKRTMMNNSAMDRHHSTSSTPDLPLVPPLLSTGSSTSSPIPTAPPAKECLASLSSSNRLSSLDPPDIPPPAYSPH